MNRVYSLSFAMETIKGLQSQLAAAKDVIAELEHSAALQTDRINHLNIDLAAKAEIEYLRKDQEQWASSWNDERKETKRLREALEKYGQHETGCILMWGTEGEPTDDGGYRIKYAGKWYRTKPIDETPMCECGFQAALDGGKA